MCPEAEASGIGITLVTVAASMKAARDNSRIFKLVLKRSKFKYVLLGLSYVGTQDSSKYSSKITGFYNKKTTVVFCQIWTLIVWFGRGN